MATIIEEWPPEWKFTVYTKELSDPGNGPPPDISNEQDKPKDSVEEENSQKEASSSTPTESELEKQQEEAQTKHRFEKGKGSGTTRLSNDQVNKVLVAITTTTNEN